MIADSMLIINRGRKVAEGKVTDLLNPADTVVELTTTDNIHAMAQLSQTAWIKYMSNKENKVLFRLHKQLVPQLVRDLVGLQIEVVGLQSKHSLEDYFLSLTTLTNGVAADTYRTV